jgi:tetratricopeptide (TPR) repeat protein
MNRHALYPCLQCFLLVAALPRGSLVLAGQGDVGDSWVGKKVIAKQARTAVYDKEGIGNKKIGTMTDLVLTVQKQASGYVLVRSTKVEGWVDAQNLVPVAKAISYFTERIRASPKDADAYQCRAAAWQEQGNFDKAIKDINDAIRLHPENSRYYSSRGDVWSDKGDYDKAIADYTEAIRIDPKYADAYVNRGLAWSEKKNSDKAFADYTDAIRIDPKSAIA